MNFSERLRELRAEKDVTQIELAKKTGLSNGCIAMLEINKREPTGNTLIALSNFLNVQSTIFSAGRTISASFKFIPKRTSSIL